MDDGNGLDPYPDLVVRDDLDADDGWLGELRLCEQALSESLHLHGGETLELKPLHVLAVLVGDGLGIIDQGIFVLVSEGRKQPVNLPSYGGFKRHVQVHAQLSFLLGPDERGDLFHILRTLARALAPLTACWSACAPGMFVDCTFRLQVPHWY